MARPSSVRPSSVKKEIASSSDFTTMPTLSMRSNLLLLMIAVVSRVVYGRCECLSARRHAQHTALQVDDMARFGKRRRLLLKLGVIPKRHGCRAYARHDENVDGSVDRGDGRIDRQASGIAVAGRGSPCCVAGDVMTDVIDRPGQRIGHT